MKKVLARVVSTTVAVGLIASTLLAGSPVSAQTTKLDFSNWSTANGNLPDFLRDSNDSALKSSVEKAFQTELDYQQNALKFNMGAPGTTQGTGGGLVDGWAKMAAIYFSGGDNVADPWGSGSNSPAKEGFLLIPFQPGRAFTLRGYMAAHRGTDGWDSVGLPLGDEFTYNGNVYQVFTGKTTGYSKSDPSTIKTMGYHPGYGGNVSDSVLASFESAYLNDSLRYQNGGLPNVDATVVSDKSVYQEFVGASAGVDLSGNATAPVSTATIGSDTNAYFMVWSSKDSKMYTIKDAIAEGWDTSSEMSPDVLKSCAAVTGAPTGEEYAYQGGLRQDFVNGSMISTDGKSPAKFYGNAASVLSFQVSDGATKINNAAHTVEIDLPSNIPLTNIVPTITVSDGATISPASGDAQDFTNPVSYTVTAANGDQVVYKVTAKALDDDQILKFEVPGMMSSDIDQASGTISMVVKADTDVTALQPTISLSDSGATVLPASGSAQDFSSPVTYQVTGASGLTKTYQVSIRKQSDANNITKFEFTGLKYATGAVEGIVDNESRTVMVTVPYGTDRSLLAPTIAVSDLAVISPDSGEARDFTKDETYTVTAESGATATYTVTVKVANPAPLPQVSETDLKLGAVANVMDDFEGMDDQIYAAMTAEYNHQRKLGFDLGTVSGDIENWNDVLIRQFFTGGMNKASAFSQVGGYLMMDRVNGMAYTLKNDMLTGWENSINGLSYSDNGAPVADEFRYNGAEYQPFAASWISYDPSAGQYSGKAVGVGQISDTYEASVGETDWYYEDVESQVNENFRQAYDQSNQNGYNLGVPLKAEVVKYPGENIVLQQFNYGGGVDQLDRGNTVGYIFQSGTEAQSAGAIYGNMLAVWQSGTVLNGTQSLIKGNPTQKIENKSVDFQDLTDASDGENGKAATLGEVAINLTIGMPTDEQTTLQNGDVVQDFENGWITAPKGDFTKAYYTAGKRVSDENRIKSILLKGVKTVSSEFNPNSDTVSFVVPDGTNLKKITPIFTFYDAKEKISPASGAAQDFTNPNVLYTVTAESGAERNYYITIQTYSDYYGTAEKSDLAAAGSNGTGETPEQNPNTSDRDVPMGALLAVCGASLAALTVFKKRTERKQ